MSGDASPSEPARSPKVVSLGKYQVVAHIATGGMGEVYRAYDTENDREVAVKVLKNKMLGRADAVERFYREARIAAQLRHENIVAVYEVGEHKGVLFLAMEYVDGIDLADHIAEQGRLDIDEARLIIYQAARALHHASKHGVVHRDIKPSNFLLTRRNGRLVVKLTDLGLSRHVHEDEPRLTRLGSTVGTIDYIAPEQARDSGQADVRSDIYSLGCTLYHMLTGQAPFAGDLEERVYQHISAEAPDLRALRPEVPAGLALVVQRMMAKDPADRYQTPRELLHGLIEVGSRPRRRRRPARPQEPLPEKEPATVEAESSIAPSVDLEPSSPDHQQRATIQAIWILGAAASALVLGLILFLLVNRRPADPPDGPPASPFPPPIGGGPIEAPDMPRPKDPARVEPERPWPPLRPDAPGVDREGLTRRFAAVQEVLPSAADAPIYRVRRQPREAGEYATLKAAFAAVQAKPRGGTQLDAVVEVHDSGPFFETGLALTGRSAIVRAAPEYRPLLSWDVELHGDRAVPPLFAVQDGSLGLEGLEVVLHSPRPGAGSLAFVHVTRGGFQARDCSFSAAGAHSPGVVLVRMEGVPRDGSPARCRLSRCLARGRSLSGLELDACTRDVLLDDTLLSGGEGPLFDCRVKPGAYVQLFLLRSTVVARGTAVRVADDDRVLPLDAFVCVAWDTLFGQAGPARGGVLLELPVKMRHEAARWQGVNSLYAGWGQLLRGPQNVKGDDPARWEKYWDRFGLERVEPEPWPATTFPEPAEVSALEYRTDRVKGAPVGFAASSWPALVEKGGTAPPTLGCPVARLSSTRERWPQWTVERFRTPGVDLLRESSAPAIPSPDDDRYHGERIDLSTTNVGARLARQGGRLGPRVVLHLFRSAAGKTTPSRPIRVKDVDLVLFFEPEKPALKGDPPGRAVLEGDGTSGPALVEVDNGNLDVIGGEVRLHDRPAATHPAAVLRVSGGSLRLHDCHLHGPLTATSGFESVLRLERGKDPSPQSLALHQFVVVSGKAALKVVGAGGMRVRMIQGLLVAGTDAIDLEPGRDASRRLAVSCVMDNVSIAAGRAAVHVGEAPGGPIEEPLLIQTRNCAFLNPFVDHRPGLLLCEGDAFRQGAVLWQGEADVYDKRLHFGAASKIPEKAEPFAAWLTLWGPAVANRAQGDFPQGPQFDREQWPLDRLVLTPVGARSNAFDTRGIGADLPRLGLLGKGTAPR